MKRSHALRGAAAVLTGALLFGGLSPATAGSSSVATPAPALAGATVAMPGCAKAQHAGGEWRSFGHDARNTRNQSAERKIDTVAAATLRPAWSFSARSAGGSGDFTGTPVIADGCLYVASNDGWVFAANADTGKKVWAKKVPGDAGINSTVTVSKGRLYVVTSQPGAPGLVALSQKTGKVLWRVRLDRQPGSDVYGTPVIYDDVLMIGVSGGSAELGDEADRYAFQGSFVLVETGRNRAQPAGTILRKTWTIRPPDPNPEKPKNNFAGGAVWSTPAINRETGMAYVGTGNPFRPQAEHKHTNALIKVDLNRGRRSFGKIVDSVKGDIDEYVPYFSELPCYDIPGNPAPYYPQGIGECGDLDMDIGASPNLFRNKAGRLLVGVGQKSGVYHLWDARTLKPVWKSIVGPPSAVGGIVGSTAIDNGAIYGPITVGGYAWSINRIGGTPRWVSPVADGAHWGNPVSMANGVVYTADLAGNLNAFDAATGAPVLKMPMGPAAGGPTPSWGGVAIARNTVYAAVGITGLPNGYVVAFRPGGGGGGAGATSTVDALALDANSTPDASAAEPVIPKGVNQALSGPQAQFYGYATPVIATERKGHVTYTNVDLVRHDIVQDPRTDGVAGPSTAPWCGRFRKGKCPIFWTPLMGLGQKTPIRGLANVRAGKTYTFYCTLHPGMRGRLIAAR